MEENPSLSAKSSMSNIVGLFFYVESSVFTLLREKNQSYSKQKRKSDDSLLGVTALGDEIWMKFELLKAVITRCDTHEPLESTIKALTIGEPHHIAHFLHT